MQRTLDHRKGVGRTALFQQLAAMEEAGMPVVQAITTLQREATPALRSQLEQVRQQLQKGMEPAAALYRSKLCQGWELQLLQSMHRGGRLAEGYAYLARHHAATTERIGRLKARLVMPAAVFILAVFIAPLPALARGDIDGGGYLARTIFPLALIAASTWLLGFALRREDAALRLLVRLPGFGKLLRRQQELHSLAVLGLLLRSGLPADQALEAAAIASVAWPQAAVRRAAESAARGGSLANALAAHGLCSESHDRVLIVAAEASGRLDETLLHFTRQRQMELDLKLDLWAEWLPRVLYFGMVVPWLL